MSKSNKSLIKFMSIFRGKGQMIIFDFTSKVDADKGRVGQ